MNAPLSRLLPVRAVRRRTVLLYAAGLLTVTLASVLSLLAFSGPNTGLLRAALLLGIALTLYGGALVSLAEMQGLQTARFGELDERQQARANQALAWAYRTVSLVLTAVVLTLSFLDPAVTFRLIRPAALGGAGLIFALTFLLATLPSAILAWTEPDITESDITQ